MQLFDFLSTIWMCNEHPIFGQPARGPIPSRRLGTVDLIRRPLPMPLTSSTGRQQHGGIHTKSPSSLSKTASKVSPALIVKL